MIVAVAACQIGDNYRIIRPLMGGVNIGVLLILAILLVARVDVKVAIRQRFIAALSVTVIFMLISSPTFTFAALTVESKLSALITNFGVTAGGLYPRS